MRKDIGIIILGALLLGLCYLSSLLSIGILFLLSIYFYYFFKYTNTKHLFKISFLYFFVFFYLTNIYLFEVLPLDFIGIDQITGFILVFLGHFILSCLMSLLYQIPYLLFKYLKHQKIQGYAILIISFTLLEMLLESFSYPMFKLALPLASYPGLIQLAAYIGISGCSFVVYLINLTIYELLMNKTVKTMGALISIGIVVLALYQNDDAIKSINEGKVALIQANVASNQKWNQDLEDANYNLHQALTSKYEKEVDLVIWPETAIPYNYKELDEAWVLSDKLILGTFDVVDHHKYNALFYKGQNEVYHKRYLVPLGEYIPSFWKNVLPLLNEFQMGESISFAKNNKIMHTPIGKIGSLICFESMVSDLSIDNIEDGAQLLLIVSNDSWFNDLEKSLHLKHAVFRAIETRKTVIRVGNTGSTAIINPQGQITQMLGNDTYGALVGEVNSNNYQSVYVIMHNGIKLLLIFGLLAISRLNQEEIQKLKYRIYLR